jgi:hypothetical protein
MNMERNLRLQQILLSHMHRYPAWEVQDIYKLAHQATLGSEHGVSDRAHTSMQLEEEISRLSGELIDPLIDPISVDGDIVRVHLRPYTHLKFPSRVLLEAFMQTAFRFRGSSDILEEYLVQIEELAQNSYLNVDHTSLEEFFSLMRNRGFPAVHHSKVFKQTYNPAYRVIARAYLPILPE